MPADKPYKEIPEICSSASTADVPWQDAVVWTENTPAGKVFFWMHKDHVSSVTWTNGNISIIPHGDTVLSDTLHAIVIMGGLAFIGKNLRAN